MFRLFITPPHALAITPDEPEKKPEVRMYFENREQAAYLLVDRLADYRGENPLILAIPRGAVPMATIIARELQGELGLVLVHKIPAPGSSEFAIGSIGLSGHIYRSPDAEILSIPDRYIEEEANRQLRVLKQRVRAFHATELPHDYKGRTVIIVDDGIATGSTALAAVREVKAQKPKEVVLAAAVAPPSTADRLRGEVDRVELLDEPTDFFAVGQFFADFPQVADEEVVEYLRPYSQKPRPSVRAEPSERT